jgi:outer membrane murein-binding lipoprotein Lpp
MDATINDVNALYSENQQLKVEVDRLKNIIKTQDNMIQAAQGLAKENTSLHSACQTLLNENSRLKEETNFLRETVQSNEEEITRLHKEDYGQYL